LFIGGERVILRIEDPSPYLSPYTIQKEEKFFASIRDMGFK
jgi:hypothetical protein